MLTVDFSSGSFDPLSALEHAIEGCEDEDVLYLGLGAADGFSDRKAFLFILCPAKELGGAIVADGASSWWSLAAVRTAHCPSLPETIDGAVASPAGSVRKMIEWLRRQGITKAKVSIEDGHLVLEAASDRAALAEPCADRICLSSSGV